MVVHRKMVQIAVNSESSNSQSDPETPPGSVAKLEPDIADSPAEMPVYPEANDKSLNLATIPSFDTAESPNDIGKAIDKAKTQGELDAVLSNPADLAVVLEGLGKLNLRKQRKGKKVKRLQAQHKEEPQAQHKGKRPRKHKRSRRSLNKEERPEKQPLRVEKLRNRVAKRAERSGSDQKSHAVGTSFDMLLLFDIFSNILFR